MINLSSKDRTKVVDMINKGECDIPWYPEKTYYVDLNKEIIRVEVISYMSFDKYSFHSYLMETVPYSGY